MKKLIPILLIICSCSNKEIVREPLDVSVISGRAVWNRISKEAPYQSYSYMPSHEGLLPGQSPHGALHRIYINSTLGSAMPVKSRIAPNGSIIIKENYTADEVLDKITVMTKVAGYSPETGDWYWTAFSPEGEVLAEGSPKGCISCHSGMKSNDYIIVKQLDK